MPVVLLVIFAVYYLKPILMKAIKRWFCMRTLLVYGRRKAKEQLKEEKAKTGFNQPKPDWVKQEIIRLKAFMPHDGCRSIANTFNRLYAEKKQMTVGKSFVYDTFRKHAYEIQVLRRKIKHAKPKPGPKQLIWGMDLTGKTDTQGKQHALLGIVEHHSRGCINLVALKDKATITILENLLRCIKHLGKPKIIRTDNEAIFCSFLFKLALWWLGIRHQTTELHCPWQNGRVERFFGTLKEKLNQWEVESGTQLNQALAQFTCWYNHVRPHQNLHGKTPAEVWQGKNIYTTRIKNQYWYDAWDGLLTGYYLET